MVVEQQSQAAHRRAQESGCTRYSARRNLVAAQTILCRNAKVSFSQNCEDVSGF